MAENRAGDMTWLPLRQAARKRGMSLVVDAAAALLWAFIATIYLYGLVQGKGYLNLGLFIFYTVMAWAFVLRRPAQRSGQWWETVVALCAIFVPPIAVQSASGGFVVTGLAVQVIGISGAIIALLSLKRSFGIAPADRGLVTTGLYRYVRHPLYASELFFYIGYLVANPSWRNAAVFALLLGIQVLRIAREERILTDYPAYARQVPWRLIPLVW